METRPMPMTGNLEENWKLWRKKFELYLTANDLLNESQERLCALALTMIGDEAFKTYHEKIESDDATNDSLEGLLEQFENLFTRKKNYTYERFKLFSCKQHPGVPVEKFIKILKEKAENCNLGDLKDDLIKIALISGIEDHVVRSQLLRNDQMNLQDAINYCIMLENLKKGSENLPTGTLDREKSGSTNSVSSSRQGSRGNGCGYCGGVHPARKCPAYGNTCKLCKQPNHFEKMCRRRRNQNNAKRNNV